MIFSVKPQIIVGNESLRIIGDLNSRKTFIVADPFIISSKIIDKITEQLPKHSDYYIFSEVKPDPTIELINQGMAELEKYDPDIVITIGGGSAIDASKSMIYKLYEDNRDKVKFLAVPTTAGTGSEVTNFSVVTVKEEKQVLISDLMLPDYALLVPELTKSVPSSITADTGMDVLTHAIEAYISKNANEFTDIFAVKAMETVFESLEIIVKDGYRMRHREKMMEASCMAGIAFTNAGLGINHSLAHILGGKLHVSHGRLNAMLLPEVIEYNVKNSEETLKKLNKLAVKLGHRDYKCIIQKIKEMNHTFNIASKIRDLNVVNQADYFNQIDEMASIAMNDRCTGTNPAVVTKINLANLLRDIY